MKKAIIILVLSLTIISCGGPAENNSVEVTHDSVGVDSSVVLPALTDSVDNPVYGGSGPRPGLNIK